MIRLALGFPGERFILLPLNILESMKDNELTGDLFIHSLGYYFRAQYHYILRPKGCGEYLLIYCKEGCGKVKISDKEYKLCANQFIIIPPNTPHSYEADNEDPWSIYWIHFMGRKASLYSKNLNSPQQVSPSDLSRIEDRLKIFEEMYQTLKKGFDIENLNYSNICLSYFLASFTYIEKYRSSKIRDEQSNSMINRVVYYMNENTENAISITDMASYIGYSPSYFYRKFILETGFSPMDYYSRLKINKATHLLLKTDMKIAQIANKTGYKDALYFSRIFTKIIGVSPQKYRKENIKIP